MESREVRFQFGPPVRTTFLGGVRHAQAGFLGAAFGSAVLFLRLIPGQIGFGLAVLTIIAGVGCAFGTIEGRPFDDWVPACSRWVVLVLRGQRRWVSPAPWVGERWAVPSITEVAASPTSNGHHPPVGPSRNGDGGADREPAPAGPGDDRSADPIDILRSSRLVSDGTGTGDGTPPAGQPPGRKGRGRGRARRNPGAGRSATRRRGLLRRRSRPSVPAPEPSAEPPGDGEVIRTPPPMPPASRRRRPSRPAPAEPAGKAGKAARGGRRTRQAIGRMAGKPSPPPPVANWQLIYTSVSGLPMGVLRDRKNKTWVAVISVQGQSFMLLDESEQVRRLSSWAAVQTSMARQGSPIARMQWLERTLTEVGDEMRTFFDERAGTTVGTAPHDSYSQLLQAAQPVTQQHETFLVLQVSAAKAGRAIKHAGGGDRGAVAVLYRELDHLQRQLRESDLTVTGFLSGDELAMLLRTQFDPEDAVAMAARQSLGSEHLVSARSAWPMATEVSWGHYRTDRMFHITYWVSEWPKLGVRPSFLSPLLLTSNGVTRTVSVVSEPIPTSRAVRKVEHEQTARLSDEEIRAGAGYRTGARRRREFEALDRRENELADGHAENRYSGYVTVSGPNLDDVEVAAATIEQVAYQCPVELRRLWGEQDSAFYCTMPMAMGLS